MSRYNHPQWRRVGREQPFHRDSPYGQDSRSDSHSRGRISSQRTYHYEPYNKDPRGNWRGFCNFCKKLGHLTQDCPVKCTNCGHPGHLATVCKSDAVCGNCNEPRHLIESCKNERVCHHYNKRGHTSRECTSWVEGMVCSNCHRPGHIAAKCTSVKVCKICLYKGHLACECPYPAAPLCKLCIASKPNRLASDVQGGDPADLVCSLCDEPGHHSRNCAATVICHGCRRPCHNASYSWIQGG